MTGVGVVARMADRVMVMYAGFVVEEASVIELYDNPRHPYTLALMEALPRVDESRKRRLKSIPGAPPNLLIEPHGCPFAARCDFVFDRCRSEMPPLDNITQSHRIACWVDVETGAQR